MKTLFSVCDLSLKSSRLHKYRDLNICLCAGLEYGCSHENCAGLDLDLGYGLDTFLNVCYFYLQIKSKRSNSDVITVPKHRTTYKTL